MQINLDDIFQMKTHDMAVSSLYGCLWFVAVPVGPTIFFEMMLEATNCDEMNIQFTGNSSGG